MVARYEGQTIKATILVVKGDGPNSLGGDWLRQLEQDFMCAGIRKSSKITPKCSRMS